jgi:hypothetical protein
MLPAPLHLIVALLLMLPLFGQTALAEICWGKVCTGAVCCGGHGTCVSFNNCACEAGYAGKECETATFCGLPTCGSSCNGNGSCLVAGGFVATGTCTGSGSLSLSCTATSADSTKGFCTLVSGTAGNNTTCTLNTVDGYLMPVNAGVTYTWTPTGNISVTVTTGSLGHCRCLPGYTGSCCERLAASLSATALDFGGQALGVASAVRSLSFANPTVNDSVTVATIVLGGSAAGDFVLGGTCAAGQSLAVGESCTVTVAFAPSATGSRGATLTLTSTDIRGNDTSLAASLAGTGTLTTDSILIDPANASLVYAGLDGGGVYVSSDGGANWTAATTQPVNRRVKALAKKSGTPLYAGTNGGGVYRASSDTTFAACAAQPANLKVLSLSLDGAGKLYAGTESGVYVSADGCASWLAISAGLP